MKTFVLFFMFNLVAAVCAIGAVFLAYHEKSGWGWMLFIAAISQSTRYTEERK